MSRVVIVVPTLNEVDHIEKVVLSLSGPENSGEPIPIWIVDGLSVDGTRKVVEDLRLDHVRIIDNPNRTQAHAMNHAAEIASQSGGVDILIRADAHAQYPPDFAPRVVDALQENGAESVVVPVSTIGGSKTQDAASALFQSWLGTGGSPHRMGLMRGYVEHGHHAGFRLGAYASIGGYDTDFRANEDAEFDYRLTKAGGRIFLENKLSIGYMPRASLPATFKQYARNGKYRIRRAIKHGVNLGLRQLVPALILPGLVMGVALAVLLSSAFWLIPLSYVFAVAVSSLVIAARSDQVHLAGLIALLAAASHFGFSAGASFEFFKCRLCPKRRAFLREDRDRLLPISVKEKVQYDGR